MGKTTLDIWSLMGRNVLHKEFRVLPGDPKDIRVSTANLAPGLYEYRITAGKAVITGKFIRK